MKKYLQSISRDLPEARPVRRPRINLRSLDGTPSASATRDPIYQSGQALVMLLFFIMIGITITSTAVFVVINNSLATTDTEQGEIARELAETGAENALLQIIRGNFANENISTPDGSVAISITNGANITIDSVGSSGNYVKHVRVMASKDGKIDVTSWKEIN